ncbi:MAG: hypothetical protein ACI8P9_000759 [Parasphingorhabdus sp.]|jgi:hypothetical protein
MTDKNIAGEFKKLFLWLTSGLLQLGIVIYVFQWLRNRLVAFDQESLPMPYSIHAGITDKRRNQCNRSCLVSLTGHLFAPLQRPLSDYTFCSVVFNINIVNICTVCNNPAVRSD